MATHKKTKGAAKSAKGSKAKAAAPTPVLAVSSRSVRKSAAVVEQVGLTAHALAVGERAALEPRLDAGLIDGLASDLQALGVVVPGVKVARATAKGATGTQEAALKSLHTRVMAIRHAVSKKLPPKVRANWGVGQAAKETVVSENVAAADLIAQRFSAAPDEARQAGILQKDVDALATERDAAAGAHGSRVTARGSSVAETAARNETERRILVAAEHVAAAGIMEHANVPTARAPFDKLAREAAEHAKRGGAKPLASPPTPPPGAHPT